MPTRPKIVQARTTSLKGSISSAETGTIKLRGLVDLYGNELAMSDFGDQGYLTIDPGLDSEEIVKFTGFTVNSDGTVDIDTGITRAMVGKSPYGSGGTASSHDNGATVIVSNTPQIYDDILDYIDAISIAGAASASETVEGIVELATLAEIDAGTSTGSTGSRLVAPVDTLSSRLPSSDKSDALDGESGTPSSTNKYLTEDKIFSSDTDQEVTDSSNTIAFGRADSSGQNHEIAFEFTPDRSGIRGVYLYKKADTGTFTGDVTARLHPDDGSGDPDTGQTLATGTIANANWTNLSDDSEFFLHFEDEADITEGTKYYIRLSASTSDNSNHPNVGGNTSGTGTVQSFNTTDGWADEGNTDLYYKTANAIGNKIGHAIQQEFTVSGTWYKPEGRLYALIEAWGGGGSGGAATQNSTSNANAAAGGGGGGAYVWRWMKLSDLSATETVTIGTGGTGTQAQTTSGSDQNTGSDGGSTSFGSHVTAFGGKGGGADALSASGGNGGGHFSKSDHSGNNIYSGGGGDGDGDGGDAGGTNGGKSYYGGGGGGGAGADSDDAAAGGGSAGTSTEGGNGGAGDGQTSASSNTTATASDGSAPGGGGGGAAASVDDNGPTATANPGNGARGQIRITIY